MRKIATAAILASTVVAFSPAAYSQAFPTKSLNIVVPIGPGGGYDFTGRLLGKGLSKELGQTVIVENKPGAGTTVGTHYVVRSAPDGYTMVIGGIGSIAHSKALVKDLPYDPGVDLVPLQLVSTNSYTLSARTGFGPKTLQEVIAYAHANPGKISMGTPGQATGQAVATALFKSFAKLDMLEVQYKNAPPIYVDMMAGRIDIFFDATGTAQAFVKSGKVRGIATSGSKRDFILPNVPTAKESGLENMVLENWTGLFAPAKTPRPIVLRLREAIGKVASTDEFKKQMTARGYSLFSPADVDAFIKEEVKRWPPLLAKAGLKPR